VGQEAPTSQNTLIWSASSIYLRRVLLCGEHHSAVILGHRQQPRPPE
jgi:hypothetical protein